MTLNSVLAAVKDALDRVLCDASSSRSRGPRAIETVEAHIHRDDEVWNDIALEVAEEKKKETGLITITVEFEATPKVRISKDMDEWNRYALHIEELRRKNDVDQASATAGA
jgi:hypothetical protein